MRSNLTLVLLLFSLAASAQTFTRFDLITGLNSSIPANYAALGDKMIFNASDTGGGMALWVTDGSDTGTYSLNHVVMAINDFRTSSLITLGNKVYFVASELGQPRQELWVSDATYSGTHRVIWTGDSTTYGGITSNIAASNGKLFFLANNNSQFSLWISDGTQSGTKMIKAFGNAYLRTSKISILGNKAYFMSVDSNGWQLWHSDGTTVGTNIVYQQNIQYNVPLNISNVLTPINSHLMFTGLDSAHGEEPWITDGTFSGTHLVKDIMPGTRGTYIWEYTIFKNKAFFVSGDGNSWGLYCSDGTQAGTSKVSTIFPVTMETTVVCNGLLFYYGSDGSDYSLAVTDGTASGTHLLKDRSGNYLPAGAATSYNNRVYWEANFNDTDSKGLYQSDGTDTGTYIILPGKKTSLAVASINYSFYQFKGSLWFGGYFDNTGMELWRLTTIPAASVNFIADPLANSIYPNPNNGNFTINTGNPSFEGIVNVYDITGRVVISKAIYGATSTLQLPIAAKGIYLIKLQSGDAISTKKILVE